VLFAFLSFVLYRKMATALPWLLKMSKILMSCEAHQGVTVGWWMMIQATTLLCSRQAVVLDHLELNPPPTWIRPELMTRRI
jgi:hypothetical protein